MKDFVFTVEIELGDSSLVGAEERVKRIPFGDNDCDFRILGHREGTLPKGTSFYGVYPELVDEQNEGHCLIRVISEEI